MGLGKDYSIGVVFNMSQFSMSFGDVLRNVLPILRQCIGAVLHKGVVFSKRLIITVKQDLILYRLTQDNQKHNKPSKFWAWSFGPIFPRRTWRLSRRGFRFRLLTCPTMRQWRVRVAQGVEPGISIKEDPNETESDAGMLPELERAAPVIAEGIDALVAGGSLSPLPVLPVEAASQQMARLREKISRMDAFCYTARQAHRQATARAAMLETELVQLSDIYDTLRYEDALRVTFAAFRLRRMAKDWWLRASEAPALMNQPWT
ncbi:hypothetical protein M9H77_29691 [Catharanthus roseus]|uniref:Uncharacterized protein n=1 Tax=Catharanthus roseus TaxID=4058 RepID=A0ACB9ZVX7_CATRO|nr:hypothetical protein M9H77_29691 [Catharanthus roseus]